MCIRDSMAVSNQNGYRSDHTICFCLWHHSASQSRYRQNGKSWQHPMDFPGGPPTQYQPGTVPLNVGGRTSSGAFDTVWLSADQAYPEDVAFTLATCSGQGQHTRSLNLNIITVKVEALQQYSVSERLRRWTRHPLGFARRGLNPLAVVFVLL